MKYLALLLIRFYQKRISPYKGFRCAHAALHQGVSCSEAVKHIIEEHGVFCGYRLVKMRFTDCKGAYQQLHENEANKSKKNDKPKKNDKDKCSVDCCDPTLGTSSCIPKKGCDLPSSACDCSLF